MQKLYHKTLEITTDLDVVLEDSKDGKSINWKKPKLNSLEVANSYKRQGNIKKWEKIERCGSKLVFSECPNGHEKKLKTADFCRNRLCPMCSWRRSRMIFGQIVKVLHIASQREKLRYIFLTLTTKTCKGHDLSEKLDKLFNGFKLLFLRTQVKNVVKGYVRTLEVTYNIETGEYHAHFHVLLGVMPSYFEKKYISQKEWQKLWQESMKLDYKPNVWVSAVKPNKKRKDSQTIESAVAETAKYAVKPDDYIFEGDEKTTDTVIRTLDEALKGRRLLAFGGLFMKIKKELKLADVEKSNLINIDDEESLTNCKCSICNSDLINHLYSWNIGYKNYIG
jgi:plasmid rolling circle replication initiator protein Rep